MTTEVTTRLVAIDFSHEIERLTEDFKGREWLFDEIDGWLKDDKTRFFILTGEPGVGKSAIAARLTQVRPDNVLAYHFCMAGNVGTITPNTVLRSLAAQLGDTLPKYGEALANTIKPSQISININQVIGTVEAGAKVVGAVINHLTASNPDEELDILLRAPLSALKAADRPNSPVFILIDSLDEAKTYQGESNLITLLAKANDLPEWVRFVCTTRPEQAVLSYFQRFEPYTLAAESQMNLDDIEQYVTYRVDKEAVRERLVAVEIKPEILTECVCALADGNFLYTKMLLNDIETGQQLLDNLAALPKSLDDIYSSFLRRFSDEDWYSRYQPILGKLAVAQEPISEAQLANFTGIHQGKIRRNLAVIEQYLDILVNAAGRKTYRLFHRSMRDYLLNEARSGLFWCDTNEEHAYIADYYLKHYQGKWSDCDLYGLRYLPLHLSATGRTKKLRKLLLDLRWLRAKLQYTDVSALIVDFDLAEDYVELRPIRKTLQQSGHILTIDKSQLAGQLLARIPEREKQLRDRILRRASDFHELWLRPLTASLATEHSIRWLRPMRLESLLSVVFSPNGLWAAHVSGSVGSPQDIVLWNLKEWQLCGPRFKTLARFNPFVLALSNDARWCIYADSVGGVHRLDAFGGEVWEGHAHRDSTIANLLAISSDGRRALSACYRGRLVVWDIEAGCYEVIYDESKNRIEALSLDESGTSGVVARRDGSVILLHLWPARERTLFSLNDQPSVLARSADNTMVVAGTIYGRIEVHSIASPEMPICSLMIQDEPTSVALSFDKRLLAIGTASGKVEIWDIESKMRSAQYSHAHTHKVECVVFPYDSARVISADSLHIKEWNIEASSEEEPDTVTARVAGKVKVTADNSHAVAVMEDGCLGMWNIYTGALESVLPCAIGPTFGSPEIGPPRGLELAAKAPRVLAWNEKLLCVWDIDSRASVTGLSVAHTRDAALTADGKGVAYISRRAVSYWRPDQGESYVLGTYDTDLPGHIAISLDGRRVLSSGGDRQVYEWPLNTIHYPISARTKVPGGGWSASWWPYSRDKPSMVAFVGPEEAIVTTGDGSLFALNIGKEQLERFAGQHGTIINKLLVTNDGKYIVTSSLDRKTMIWHLGERRCIAVFDTHPGYVEQLAKSAPRALLFSPDGVLKIVSLRDGSLLAAFQGDKQITTGAADVELEWIVACDESGQMHFFHVEDKT